LQSGGLAKADGRRRLLKKLQGALVAISAFFGASGIASIMLQNWLRNKGFLDHPEDGLTRLVAWITNPARATWILAICVVLVVLPVLRWCWHAVHAWWDGRKKKLGLLGRDPINLSVQIRHRQGGFRNPWPGNFLDGRGRLEAVFTRAQKLWIKTPGRSVFESDEGLAALLEYLDVVGAYLSQGNYWTARSRSHDLS